MTLPSGAANGAVGLNGGVNPDNWATDGPAGNRGDVTFRGTGYPICGLTFALIFKGLSADGGATNPIGRLNIDQRRTLYSYVSYILSSAGQDKLTKVLYQSLTPSNVSTFRTGFQTNY